MAVDLLSEPIFNLSELIIHVINTTADFKPELKQLQQTLNSIAPKIDGVVKLNRVLDHEPDMQVVSEIQNAQKLVSKCLKIKRNFMKKYTHSLKLNEANKNLLRVFQIDVQADQWRDIKETLSLVKSLSLDAKDSWRSRGCEIIERGKLGGQVPRRPTGVVAFDEPLRKLKSMVLPDRGLDDDGSSTDCDADDDDYGEDCSVVVLSAAGGYGKTTLATMLCHDSDIKETFGENIFFVTVSEKPNFMVLANDLINPSPCGPQVQFQNHEDAKNKLGNFLGEKAGVRPILLVLDDVWQDSFIKNFIFEIEGYQILVTSRMVFSETKYNVFQLDPLSHEDAKTIFLRSAQGKRKPSTTIDDDLVNQLVEYCKKHPLTLSVVGSLLSGKDETVWRSMLKTMSQGNSSVLDLNDEILGCLERSFDFLENKFKEYYLDFGLFQEDQRIPASVLLNIWVHLYNHDHYGSDTLVTIFELSYRNLVSLMSTGKSSSTTDNYCDKQFVTQHDLLRQLAINLNSVQPVAQRPRLIISAQEDLLITNARGEDRPISIEQVQGPMQARILSISTGESFSSTWCNMEVPNVEVCVLNLMSKTYTLPQFLEKMQKLKILNVTNYGLYPTDIKNFDILGCLSNLTTIRFERVAIPALGRSILALLNLQRVSFITCNVFEKLSSDYLKVWPQLVEIEIDYCQDLEEFPSILCRSAHLKRLSITNCNEMCELSEELGNLTSMETLSLHSCTKLEKLPESISRLQKLSILDISDCLSLSKLPEQMGKLSALQTIYMRGCTGIHELPPSVEKLSNTLVVCNEEISYQWREFHNVKIHLVEEDRLETLMRII